MNDGDLLVDAAGSPRTARQKALLAAKVLLGLLAIALLVALALLRTWPPLDVVMTGSMEPTIKVGDVVVMGRLDRPAEVGDIVAVHPPQSIQHNLNYPPTVIHRIVKIDPGGKVYTKGDARKQRDPFTEPRDAIKTHVVATIPGVGRIVAFFTSPLGLIWVGLGLLLFVLLPYFELRRDQMELEQAEVGSLAGMRLELWEVAQRVEADDAGAAPPAIAAPTPPAGHGEPAPARTEGGELESELEEIRGTIRELVGAVGEYGEHLRSHTAVLQGMSAASQDLAATVATLRASLPTPAGPAPPPPQPVAPAPQPIAPASPPPAPPIQPAATPSTPPAVSPPQPVAAAPEADRVEWSAAEQARYEAERFIRWQEQRAAEIATAMGFHDPLGAARQAPLDDAADDESIERKLWELAFENPHLLAH